MSNQRRLVLIVGGLGVFVILVTIASIQFSPKQASTAVLVEYTDSVTGETRNALPDSNTDTKHGEVILREPSLISVAGIQNFYDSISPTLSGAINDQLTTFVRAHAGPGNNEASVVNAKVKQTSSNPTVYSFEMTTKHPEARYGVTVTMQDNALVAPVVQITEEQQ